MNDKIGRAQIGRFSRVTSDIMSNAGGRITGDKAQLVREFYDLAEQLFRLDPDSPEAEKVRQQMKTLAQTDAPTDRLSRAVSKSDANAPVPANQSGPPKPD